MSVTRKSMKQYFCKVEFYYAQDDDVQAIDGRRHRIPQALVSTIWCQWLLLADRCRRVLTDRSRPAYLFDVPIKKYHALICKAYYTNAVFKPYGTYRLSLYALCYVHDTFSPWVFCFTEYDTLRPEILQRMAFFRHVFLQRVQLYNPSSCFYCVWYFYNNVLHLFDTIQPWVFTTFDTIRALSFCNEWHSTPW